MVRQGDIIYISFDPRLGHEQAGERPALVLSNTMFNMYNNMTLLCPITSSKPKNPFHVLLDDSTKTKGTILCDHMRMMDINARKYRYIESVPKDILEEVVDISRVIIET